MYCNVNSELYPCSFSEGGDKWETGLNIAECDDFLKDIWFNERMLDFACKARECRKCNIGCSIFDI